MYKSLFKRILDLILAILALPFCVIILIIIGSTIYLQDKGPIFYFSFRHGKNGKVFKMYKLRSMFVNAPDIRNSDNSTYNGDDDPRVTKIGRFIRKTSIDELPQILNVLKGDMSFVGPRPNLATKDYEDMPLIEKERIKVLPGITGYNQAYYRNSVTIDEKFKNDVYYVEHLSFMFDIKIVVRTIVSVLNRENIYVDQNGNVINTIVNKTCTEHKDLENK